MAEMLDLERHRHGRHTADRGQMVCLHSQWFSSSIEVSGEYVSSHAHKLTLNNLAEPS